MERMRRQIIQAKQALPLETDEAKKLKIRDYIDQMTANLTESNKAMADAYKYSLSRTYEYVVEDSEIYLQLSREEISNL
jgi:hypothetical protein